LVDEGIKDKGKERKKEGKDGKKVIYR